MELFSLKSEQAILGSIFLDKKLIEETKTFLDEDDFYDYSHKMIFKAMVEIFDSGSEIDYITVIEKMKMYSKVSDETVDYILSLSTYVPTTNNIKEYLTIVKENSVKRYMKEKANVILEYIDKYPATEIMNYAVDKFTKRVVYNNVEYNDFDEDTSDYLVYLDTDDSGDRKTTGFQILDDMLTINKTDLITLAGRPGSGKSAYALNLADAFAERGNYVTYISLEMGKTSLRNRLYANLAGVENKKIKKKDLTSDEWYKLKSTINNMKDYHLNIYDKSMTVEHICNYAKKLHSQGRLDVLFVDHMLLVDTKKKINSRAQQVNYVSWQLKTLAMELKIPVIALTQLGRGNEKEKRTPMLSDLKESGEISPVIPFPLISGVHLYVLTRKPKQVML